MLRHGKAPDQLQGITSPFSSNAPISDGKLFPKVPRESGVPQWTYPGCLATIFWTSKEKETLSGVQTLSSHSLESVLFPAHQTLNIGFRFNGKKSANESISGLGSKQTVSRLSEQPGLEAGMEKSVDGRTKHFHRKWKPGFAEDQLILSAPEISKPLCVDLLSAI